MRLMFFVLSLLAVASIAQTETKMIDLEQIPAKRVHNSADIRLIAATNAGVPSVVVLEINKGVVVPPHATNTGLRLLTVLSGDMSWGDGDKVNTGQEKVYSAGSHLLIQPVEMHWLAARSDDVRVQIVLLHDQKLTPQAAKQVE